MRVKLLQERDVFTLQVRSDDRKDPRVYSTATFKGNVNDISAEEFLKALIDVRDAASSEYARVLGLQRYNTSGGE